MGTKLNNNEEEWKPVKGFEDFYMVSALGEIRSKRNDKILVPTLTNKYYSVTLCGLIRKNIRVHRIIATAFIANPDDLPQINHKNGNKLDNSAVNLEWSSPSQNIQHALKNDLFNPSKGDNHCCAKVTSEQVVLIRKIYNENPKVRQIDLAVLAGISRTTINHILKRKNWKHI